MIVKNVTYDAQTILHFISGMQKMFHTEKQNLSFTALRNLSLKNTATDHFLK